MASPCSPPPPPVAGQKKTQTGQNKQTKQPSGQKKKRKRDKKNRHLGQNKKTTKGTKKKNKHAGQKKRHRDEIKDGTRDQNDIGVCVCWCVFVCLGCADLPSAKPPFRGTALPRDRPPQDRPKFRFFFPLSHSLFVLFFSLSLSRGVFSWNFGGVFEGRDPPTEAGGFSLDTLRELHPSWAPPFGSPSSVCFFVPVFFCPVCVFFCPECVCLFCPTAGFFVLWRFFLSQHRLPSPCGMRWTIPTSSSHKYSDGDPQNIRTNGSAAPPTLVNPRNTVFIPMTPSGIFRGKVNFQHSVPRVVCTAWQITCGNNLCPSHFRTQAVCFPPTCNSGVVIQPFS